MRSNDLKPVYSSITGWDVQIDFQQITVLPDGTITAAHTETSWWNTADIELVYMTLPVSHPKTVVNFFVQIFG